MKMLELSSLVVTISPRAAAIPDFLNSVRLVASPTIARMLLAMGVFLLVNQDKRHSQAVEMGSSLHNRCGHDPQDKDQFLVGILTNEPFEGQELFLSSRPAPLRLFQRGVRHGGEC